MASHRRTSQPGQTTFTGVTVLSAALATATAALSAPPASAEPPGQPAASDAPTARLDTLYEQAERATEKFNGADERARALRHEVAHLRDRTARAQERVNRMRGRLGALAAAQYRSGGISPTVRLLLSERPESYLEKAAALDRLDRTYGGELRDLRAAQWELDEWRRETAEKLGDLAVSRKAVARHKKNVQRKLATAQRLLNALPRDARTAYDRASRGLDRDEALPDLSDVVPPSGRAAAAVAAARAAVGAPYAWGSSGPAAFDCSGLTQWAYGQAGISLPRSSQAQRAAGRPVPLDQAQPGDLVIYRSDGSHVGMYVGNGQIVHAPYPGARVRYDPIGMMPIAGVTRP
ncbi:C40 family peptidase [Streptomyces halobius]|uniref:C40 family peptidase n=1 Tax=Streptomyces halobius TaxID=2879846 RepID=A0ABY4MDU5_9ACTN|nr:NlpC/P60 family protein [Streptomyces halobius]UQA95949.1 C40 family peptidase [Streptomyces halobius]